MAKISTPQKTPTKEELEKKSSDALLGEAEPWEKWETKFVLWSIGIAFVGLIILGWLVNKYLLSAF